MSDLVNIAGSIWIDPNAVSASTGEYEANNRYFDRAPRWNHKIIVDGVPFTWSDTRSPSEVAADLNKLRTDSEGKTDESQQ